MPKLRYDRIGIIFFCIVFWAIVIAAITGCTANHKTLVPTGNEINVMQDYEQCYNNPKLIFCNEKQ